MTQTVTLIPGDGIGPEITDATLQVLEAAGANVEFETCMAGQAAIDAASCPLPEDTIESIKRNKVALKGPVTTPVGGGFRSVNVELRQRLELFCNLRPVKSIPGIHTPFAEVDLIIVRENSEDLYAGIEFEQGSAQATELIATIERLGGKTVRADSGISIKPISEFASKRITKWAFDYAVRHNRQKVTAVHKANIMKYSDGLFLQAAEQTAADYAGKVEFDTRIVDAVSMQLVQNPHDFDVLVLPNLYGDIISDLCSGLVGGLGLVPGANLGAETAVFEPVHGSAPNIAGQGIANPTALILSACLMLDHVGQGGVANQIRLALNKVYAEGQSLTSDIVSQSNGTGEGAVSTTEFARAVIAHLPQ